MIYHRHLYECACARCLGVAPDDDDRAGEGSARHRRLLDLGYDGNDGEGWTYTRYGRVHTARRDHADGTIKAGERWRTVTRYRVDPDGGGSRRRRKVRA